MHISKRTFYLFYSPLFTHCTPSNVPFIYSIPGYFPNAPLQTSRLASPFPFIYILCLSKRHVYLFHSLLFTQCTNQNIRFSYSIHRYLHNAPIQKYRLAIPFPAIYPMRPSKHLFYYSIPQYLPNALL